MTAGAWSETDTEFLVKNWASKSATQISKLLGDRHSRNAVISKATRMKLSKAPGAATKPKPRPKPKAPPRPPAPPKPKPPTITAPDPLNVHMMDLEHNQCRWPIGDPRQPGFAFCGHRIAIRSYCPYHTAMAFQRTQPKEIHA